MLQPSADLSPGGGSLTTGPDRTTGFWMPGFFITACALTWAVWIPLMLSRQGLLPFSLPAPLYFLGAFGPMLSALIFTWRAERWPGVRHLLGTLLHWRVSVRWYAVALGLPLIAGLLGAAAVWATSGDDTELEFTSLATLLASFGFFMLVVVGEELGWRGYALPHLQRSLGALKSSLIIGLAWAIWHVPAFWFSGLLDTAPKLLLAFAAFVPFTLVASVILTWITNGTGSSVLLATMHHAAFVFAGLTNGASEGPIPYFTVFGLTLIVVASMIVWRCGWRTGRRVPSVRGA